MDIGPQQLRFASPLDAACTPRRLALTLRDGYQTSVYWFAPHAGQGAGSPPRRPVVYVHGIQSHAGWFNGSAQALARAGFPVYVVTRRGSGDNAAARGHAQTAGVLLDDVDVACQFTAAHHRENASPAGEADDLHLLGVSWGGKLLACYCVHPRRTASVRSLTLVAPGIAPQVDVGVTTKLAVALALLAAPMRRFDVPLSNPELFTDNEAMRQYLRDDPLRLHRATARFLYASRVLDRQLTRAARGALAVPTSLLLATRDRIIDNARTRAAVERLTDGRARALELDAAHTMDFEPDPAAFHAALVAWASRP